MRRKILQAKQPSEPEKLRKCKTKRLREQASKDWKVRTRYWVLTLLMRRRTILRARSQRRNRLHRFVLVDRRQRRFQRNLQNLVHGIDEVQLHGVAQIFGNLGQILFVVPRQDDLEESGAMCRQQFFLESADRQH